MIRRRRGAKPYVSWYGATLEPKAYCESCSWTVDAAWWYTGHQLRDHAQSHARAHPGHRVVVKVLDRVAYVAGSPVDEGSEKVSEPTEGS